MNKTLFKTTTLVSIILSGCATQSIGTFQPFQENDLNALVDSGYQQKTNTFYVINDSSSSMGEIYQGSEFTSATKLSVEKELLNRMNKTIPNLTLSSGLRSFGYGSCLSWDFTQLNQAVQNHTSASFESAINSLQCSSGGTPPNAAFEAAKDDLASSSGNTAVILLSDGNNYDSSPVAEIQALQDQLGDKFCLYTVWVGNEKDQGGQAVLQQLADISGCGFSTTASDIASSDGMADFVTKVMLNPGAAPLAMDTDGDADGDGVPDSRDKCPNTPKGAIVDGDGCWAFHDVLFDFDKATINPGFEQVFDNAIKVLKLNPGLTVEIQGHTDSIGSEQYNLDLSERRAIAVKQHLVESGVDASRLTTKGLGESEPVASNQVEEGRAQNRRVYYKRTDI